MSVEHAQNKPFYTFNDRVRKDDSNKNSEIYDSEFRSLGVDTYIRAGRRSILLGT